MAVNWVRLADGVPLWPLETVLDAVAEAGFRAVGLDHYTLAPYDPRKVRALLDERGLRCSDVGIVAVGELEQAALERLAESARVLGAELCIAALYRPLPHDAIVRDLRRASHTLAIRLAFEFTAYGSPTRLAEAVAICNDVGWERCGLLVDAWHVFRGGESLADIAALEDERIALVHLDDGAAEPHPDPIYDGRFRRRLPGTGSFDLDGLADALADAGYAGPIALEVLSEELQELPPAECARRLRQAALAARLG
jgi:sugar phosphate isomerase/epimerase